MEGEEHFGTGTICEILKQSGYSPHSILLLNNFAGIGAIVPLASFRDLVDMPSIPLDEVFLRLVIQAMISSAQVPSRTKDWEMDFIKVVKEVLVGRIPFPMDIPMEEKYSLIIMIFYCGLMVHIIDTRARKVFCCTSAHITETVFAHDQHWEEQGSSSSP